jgi:phosphomannomutase
MPPIKFGTSGWRAIIADEFTLENVQRVVGAISRYVLASSHLPRPSLLVGYDTRFLSPEFAAESAKLLVSNGIDCFLATEAVPTPAVAYEIRRRGTSGAINFTASHNPPEYNGIKFSMPNGAPALPEVTREIERQIEAGGDGAFSGEPPRNAAPIEKIDLRAAYLEDLARKVNLGVIRAAGLRLVYDPLYGTGRGYLDGLLRDNGIGVVTIHDHRDVLFGGHPPEPADEYLGPLKQAMAEKGAHLGLATDGDADRFGILDEGGAFLSPNHMLALLFDYLVESRGWLKEKKTNEKDWKGGAGRSVATTHLIDAVAGYHKIPVYETPVGFKYIGELIEEDKLVLGGEESAGLTIRHHVPEKDGILACLLVAEMVAARRKPLGRQLQELFGKVGSYYPSRSNVTLSETVKKRFTQRIGEEYSSFDGRRVIKTVRTDGLKLILDDGSWILFRLSGTEPVCRLYTEARTENGLEELTQAARRFLFG